MSKITYYQQYAPNADSRYQDLGNTHPTGSNSVREDERPEDERNYLGWSDGQYDKYGSSIISPAPEVEKSVWKDEAQRSKVNYRLCVRCANRRFCSETTMANMVRLVFSELENKTVWVEHGIGLWKGTLFRLLDQEDAYLLSGLTYTCGFKLSSVCEMRVAVTEDGSIQHNFTLKKPPVVK